MTTLLVVDDDASIRFTLREICEFAGFSVVEAENGKIGLQKFSEQSCHAVLVDYHMPEINGVEMVQRIRNIDQDVPIIVLTVDERMETAQRFLAAGATDFSVKPVRAPDLISRIQVNLQLAELRSAQRDKEKDVFVSKGISPITLRTICEFFQEKSEPASLEEVAAHVGLAYPTVHRYINHLVEENWVQVVPQYRKIGRPKNLYSRVVRSKLS